MKRLFEIIVTITFSFISNSLALAQMPTPTPKTFKDIKFFNGDGACLISEKEQQEASEYSIDENSNYLSKPKMALLVTKLRFLNNSKFDDVLCGLRFFADQYVSRNFINDDESANLLFQDYTKLIIKLSKDSNYKNDFDAKLKNNIDSNIFLNSSIIDLNLITEFDLELAKKIFIMGLKGKSVQYFTNKDLKNLFSLYYSKKITPPQEVKDLITSRLPSSIQNTDFFEIYLNYIDDLSYDDIFKNALEQFNSLPDSKSLKRYVSNKQLMKKIFSSKYVIDSLKCKMAKDYISINTYDPDDLVIKDLNKNSLSCLGEIIAQFKQYVIPADKCPLIKVEKSENKDDVIKNMPDIFYNKWLSCRNKCIEGDKCIAVKNGHGRNVFINNKFHEDKNLIQSFKEKSWVPNSNSLAPAESIIGECKDNQCVEKVEICNYPDIIEKIEKELKVADFKSCVNDSDCKSVFVGPNCLEIATNKLLASSGYFNPASQKKNKDYGPTPVNSRYNELVNACKLVNGVDQLMRSCDIKLKAENETDSKCIDKICKIMPSISETKTK